MRSFALHAVRLAFLISWLPADASTQAKVAALRGEHVPADRLFLVPPVAADLDRDGRVDLVAWDPTGEQGFRRLRNRGALRYEDAFAYPVPANGTLTVVLHLIGDVDGDGWPDVYARRNDRAFLWWGDGTGGLVLSGRSDLANPGTLPMIAGDFDGDRRTEFVTALHYLEHDGRDGLRDDGASRLPALAPNATAGVLVAGDVDGDGDLDLVVREENVFGVPGGRRLWVWSNDGSGRFAATATIEGAPVPWTMADVDDDGRDDLIAATHQGSNLLVMRSDGNGGFATVLVVDGPFVRAVALDLDGDHDPDLAATSRVAEGLVVVNDGAGRWRSIARPWPGVGAELLASIGDGDGDGRDDLYVEHVGVMSSRGDGTFAVASGPSIPGVATASGIDALLRDADGDGDHDLFCSGVILTNDGTGRFEVRHALSSRDSYSRLVPWDFDRDGDRDVFGWSGDQAARILIADGGTLIGELVIPAPALCWSSSSALIDLDADGHEELVLACSNDAIACRWNGSLEVFGASRFPVLAELRGAIGLQSVDLDGDGRRDLAAGFHDPSPVRLLLQTSSGIFVRHDLAAHVTSAILEAADLDGDGDQDLLCNGNQLPNAPYVLRNDGAPAFAQLPVATFPGLIGSLGVTDLDGDRDADLIFGYSAAWGATSSVAWARGDGRGAFLPAEWLDLPMGSGAAMAIADCDGDRDDDLLLRDEGFAAVGGRMEFARNLTRQLELPFLAQPNEDFVIELTARPGELGVPRVACLALGTTLLPGVVELDGLGAWRLDLTDAVVLPPLLIVGPAGRARQTWRMPALPAAIGRRLWVQGIVLDAVAGFATTNLAGREIR